MLRPWKTLSSSTTYTDRWLTVRSDRCLTSGGTVIEPYHVLEYPTWVNAIALTEDDRVVLVREYRHGLGTISLGLPSGTVEPGEDDPLVAMRRELREETGYAGGQWTALGSLSPNPANQSNLVWTFLAFGVYPAHPTQWDPNEEIEVVLEDFVEFAARMSSGRENVQAMHASATFFAVAHILNGTDEALAALRPRLRDRLFAGR